MAIPEGLTAIAWTALCAVLAPAVFGAGIVRWFGLGPRHGWRVFVAWSYLVGHYVLAHATFLWLACRQPLPGYCLPAFAAIGGTALLAAHRHLAIAPAAAPLAAPRRDRWLGLLCLLLAVVFVDQFLLVNVRPILSGDDADIWSAKAKVLYTAPDFQLTHGLGLYVSHADYPLFNPLVQVLAFASHGRVLQFENRLPIQCFGLALLLLLSAAVGRRTSPWIAACTVIAFASSSFSWCTMTAYADVMVAFGLLAAVDGWLRWQETGERVWWRLCCFGLAAALASKNEGTMLVAAAVAVAVVLRLVQRRRATAPRLGWQGLWLLVPIAAMAAHRVFNACFDCANDLLANGLFHRIPSLFCARWLPVAEFYGSMLIDTGQGRWLVLLMLAAGIARGRRALAGPQALPLLLVVMSLLGYMLVFVGTYFDLQWHLLTAADRTVLHVLPVAALGLCAMLGDPRAATAVEPGGTS